MRQHWHLILLVCLAGFHGVNNWKWLSENVTILGSDPRRYLITVLTYSDMLKPLNLGNVFYAVTLDEYRPPLFHLSAVPLTWLFGPTTDIATMVNAFYMAVLLGATYAIGKKMFGSHVGLLASFVLSTFPMIYAMSRYFYIDFALTAMVALNVALLLRTDRFQRKGWTLLYGLSFGLGMLVKWTFVVFALWPALLVFLRSGLSRRVTRKLETVELDKRWALLSGLMGLGVSMVWYLPNLDRAREMPLGLWLLPLFWLSLAVAFYALSRPSTQEANLLGAVTVAVSSASIWYLPRIGFLREFFFVAYGRPGGRAWGFVPYFRSLVDEQLSLFYLAVLLLVLISLGFWHRRRLKALVRHDVLTSDLAVLGCWALFPYLVFSLRASTGQSRFIMPILPPLALLIACGLWNLPWRKLRIGLVTIVILVGLTQFFVLSYDTLGWLGDFADLRLPSGGEFNLFAHSHKNQLPDTGRTDSRYWIMPDLLKFIRDDCLRGGRQRTELGILMRTGYVNAPTFELVSIAEGYSGIAMRELARSWSSAPVYPQLFEVDYLVLKDGSQEGVNRDETRELVGAIFSGSAAFLSEVFEVAQQYPLPDGDTVYLFRKRYHLDRAYADDDYRALAHDAQALGTGDDAIVFEIPEQIEIFGRHYRGSGTPYPLPSQHPLDKDGTLLELETIAVNHDMIAALFWGEEAIDPGHVVEGWLNRCA